MAERGGGKTIVYLNTIPNSFLFFIINLERKEKA